MVEVPGVIVNNPGSPAAFQLPDTFIIEDPKLSNLTAAVLQPACELNDDQVHVVPFVFKVPSNAGAQRSDERDNFSAGE